MSNFIMSPNLGGMVKPSGEKPAPIQPKPANTQPQPVNTQPKPVNAPKPVSPVNVSITAGPELVKFINETKDFLTKAKMPALAKEVENIANESTRQKFTVAVVGEFSRGKSTFINKMFGRDLLPVANMPTTAMLTRIRYSKKEALTIYNADTKQKHILPLQQDSWDDYIADDNGNDPNGVAFVGIDFPWLKNGIEVIDTPGAGDLEAKRAAVIGDALNGSDSAIITISAEVAMSMSEKLFIEERLISKKTPYLMLIITKLDRIDVSQRNSIIDFVKEKLKMWKMGNIPVYVPDNMPMPDNKYASVMGMDKVFGQINSWINDSGRKKLTEQWICLKIKNVLSSAEALINEQKQLAQAESEEKKKQIINQKMETLSKLEETWKDIKHKMAQKSDECYSAFLEKASAYKETIAERLQHEMSHTQNPKKWWEEDYPYKLKIEMTNMSVSMENLISRQVTKDATWLNTILERNFKTSVSYDLSDVAEKQEYTNFAINSDVQLADMSKGKTISRIGVTTLSIASALMLASFGGASIIGTMGVGTGGSIISEGIFKKKIDAQKELLRQEINAGVPKAVNNAMTYSEGRIRAIYTNLIEEATNQQQSWAQSQKAVIDVPAVAGGENPAQFDNVLKAIKTLGAKADKYIES